MAITPYTPTPFAIPVVNPAVGGSGTPYPYISNSEYGFAPTAMDVNNLVPGGNTAQQAQSLADTLRRASGWADRICFGADPAVKGASLCATLSVETDTVKPRNGILRLFCDYKPIVQVNGVDVGFSMQALTSVGASVAQEIHIGRRTIFVPMFAISTRTGDTGSPPGEYWPAQWQGGYSVVWSYVNGYPHTYLTGTVTAGTNTCTVAPTDGGTGLLGVIAGATQLTLVDGANTERFTVQSVSGTTITATTNFTFTHTPPALPDFLPVTALPADVSLAVIFLATTLIKTRGDNSLVLAELTEPHAVQAAAGDEFTDLKVAMDLLMPFRVTVKAARH